MIKIGAIGCVLWPLSDWYVGGGDRAVYGDSGEDELLAAVGGKVISIVTSLTLL